MALNCSRFRSPSRRASKDEDLNYDNRDPVSLSETRDVPLLLAIRNATFITHDQLFQSMKQAGLEWNRNSFNWRVKRYLSGMLVRQFPEVSPYKGAVYAITRFGLATLESYAEVLTSIDSESATLTDPIQVPHFLELNEIRQRFFQSGLLQMWTFERELASLNIAGGRPTAKDYDALLKLRVNGRDCCAGLEYERTTKSLTRYEDIYRQLANEKQVDVVLYLMANLHMIFPVSDVFREPDIPICFGAARSFRESGMEAKVVMKYGSMTETLRLSTALETLIAPEIIAPEDEER